MLDAGTTLSAEDKGLHSLALSYDAKRKVIYAIQAGGGARALKLDVAAAKAEEKLQVPGTGNAGYGLFCR